MKKTIADVISSSFALPTFHAEADFPTRIMAFRHAWTAHCEQSQELTEFLEQMMEQQPNIVPTSDIEILKLYVATFRGGLDRTSPAMLPFMCEVVRPIMNLQHKYVMMIANTCPDCTWMEREIICVSGELAGHLDDLFLSFYDSMVEPYNELTEEQQKVYNEWVSKNLSRYDYTVFNWQLETQSVASRWTWAEVWPNTIEAISNCLDRLSLACCEEYPKLNEYFMALKAAYNCRSVHHLEVCWAAVDAIWIQDLGSRFIPVHGIEEEHLPCTVWPEFWLTVRAPGIDELRDSVEQATLEVSRDLELPDDMQASLKHKLQNNQADFIVNLMFAGCNLFSQSAGKLGPNRAEVQEVGMRTLLVADSVKSRIETYKAEIRHFFDEDTAEKIIALFGEFAWNVYVLCHEAAHAVCWSPEVDANLGEAKMSVEEGKTTAIAFMIAEKINPQHATQMGAMLLGRCFRSMTRAIQDHEDAHRFEERSTLTMLHRACVFYFNHNKPNGLAAYPDQLENLHFMRYVKELASAAVAAYLSGDPANLSKVIERFVNMQTVNKFVDIVEANRAKRKS